MIANVRVDLQQEKGGKKTRVLMCSLKPAEGDVVKGESSTDSDSQHFIRLNFVKCIFFTGILLKTVKKKNISVGFYLHVFLTCNFKLASE